MRLIWEEGNEDITQGLSVLYLYTPEIRIGGAGERRRKVCRKVIS